jgi:hypothetical protein
MLEMMSSLIFEMASGPTRQQPPMMFVPRHIHSYKFKVNLQYSYLLTYLADLQESSRFFC